MISVASLELHTQEASPPAAAPPQAENIVFRSRFPDIHIHNNIPLHTYCFEKLGEFADKPCLILGPTSQTYTFAETHLLCRRVAAGFVDLGMKQGDVILILLQNCPQFVFTFIAASFLGAATTTANPFCTSAEIHKQFTSCGAKIVVTQSIYVDKLRCWEEFNAGLVVITVDDPTPDCLSFSVLSAADEAAVPEVSIDADDTVALPFSSGTTGLPKGVQLTHRSLISSIAQQVDGENPNLYLRTDDVVLCVLPLFHIYSLNSVLLCSLRAGASVLMMPKFEIGAMLGLIERHKVSVAAVVPPLVLALAKNPVVESYDLSSIRIVISGAAPLGKELETALRCRLPQAILGQVNWLFFYSCFFFFVCLFVEG